MVKWLDQLLGVVPSVRLCGAPNSGPGCVDVPDAQSYAYWQKRLHTGDEEKAKGQKIVDKMGLAKKTP